MPEKEFFIPELLPPSEDGVFKTLLTHPDAKPALRDVISSALDMRVVDVTVRNVELPISHILEKRQRFDVNVKIDDGSQADVEMQSMAMQSDNSANAHRRLRARAIYNLCDLHSSQDGRGADYSKLLNSYQIMFCGFTVFPETERFHNRFSFRDERGAELLNAVGIVFVEISKLGETLKKSVDELTGIEQWALFFKYASETKFKEKLAKIAAKREAIKVATELLANISKDENERALFRSRRKLLMDETTNLNAAKEEGLEEGIEVGASNAKREIAKDALAMGIPPEQVAKFTRLSIEEIRLL